MPSKITISDVNIAYGAVCGKGHVRDVKLNTDGLSQDNFCPKCSKRIHRVCPNCNHPIRVKKYRRQDGSTYWSPVKYCYNCNEAYPWGPGLIRKWIDRNVPQSSNTDPTPDGEVPSYSVRMVLQEMKYGDEVTSHINDGDKCYRSRLWFPALTMYIHAIEWAVITYLEDVAGLDVIEKERDGMRYYLAGGEHSLLDELEACAEVDQKTISFISQLNTVERRWIAHHKSGETFQDDVDAVRSRLKTIVEDLFEPLTDRLEAEEMDGDQSGTG